MGPDQKDEGQRHWISNSTYQTPGQPTNYQSGNSKPVSRNIWEELFHRVCHPKFKAIRIQENEINSTSSQKFFSEGLSQSKLLHSLRNSDDTTVGLDKIHYQFPKHIPPSILPLLLESLNNIWKSWNIPRSWQEATIIRTYSQTWKGPHWP